MGYHLSVDGGGTKLIAVLFDEKFNLISCGRGGAINPNFSPMSSIENTMRQCLLECLGNWPGIEIENVYISMPGPSDLFLKILKTFSEYKKSYVLSEGVMSLFAGVQCRKGAIALSGTGSGVFWIDGDKQYHLGGWGSLLGDEGSGYNIGREGLIAAVRSSDGRGPGSVLEDMVMEQWKLNKMWDMVPKVYHSPTQRADIASISYLVSKAARAGDAVAMNILSRAGEQLAEQMITLLRKNKIQGEFSIATAGGAWKGCKVMFDVFRDPVSRVFPQCRIAMPMFEPVMGGVICEAMGDSDYIDGDRLNTIKRNFNKYLFSTQWEEVCLSDKRVF